VAESIYQALAGDQRTEAALEAGSSLGKKMSEYSPKSLDL
jgi:hypothetical protein